MIERFPIPLWSAVGPIAGVIVLAASGSGSQGPVLITVSVVLLLTTVLQGVVHLVILATYLFITIVP
ncbi:MAG: hypothetical protein WAW73_12360 [Rhodoferax sp.]